MRRLNLICLVISLLISSNLFGHSPNLVEDFEDGVIPDTWTIYDMNQDGRKWESDFRTSVSGSWCVGVSANSDGSKNDWLITPALYPEDLNCTFSFYSKSQVPLPEYLEDFKILVSHSDTKPENFTELIGEVISTPAEWVKYSYDLSSYIGQQIYVAIINESTDKSVLFVDDISAPFFYYNYDLKITNIEGPTIPVINQQHYFDVTIENIGWLGQNDYQVRLCNTDGTEIAIIDGDPIGSFEKKNLLLPWTPQEAIATSIYAEIIFNSDEDISNNVSKDWYLSVRSDDVLNIITGTNNLQEFSPIFFPAKTSLSETIYMADEIGIIGNIIEIDYFANFQYEVREKNIRIWMGETKKTELDMKWIPSSELDLVYEGQITIPKNYHTIPIRLNKPYRYTGGNLVVMIERCWDDQNYGYENVFNSTSTDRLATIQYESNFEPTDPVNPSTNPWLTNTLSYFPDAQFVFDINNMGSLSGIVTDEALAPIENARIFADEINLASFTNPDGQYSILHIYDGQYHFYATKHGYYDGNAEIEILPNQSHQLDFILRAIPEVVIDGKIVGSNDTTLGIASAKVLIEGYEFYEAITDSAGYFFFPGVFCNKTYVIKVKASGYHEYCNTLELHENSVSLGTIILNQLTPPPIQVTAVNLDKMSMISWIGPNDLPENDYRYDDGKLDLQIGFEQPLPNSVLGAAFSSTSIVKSISWLLTDEVVHDSVQLLIFGLDYQGKPDVSQVLYKSGMVPNTDNIWNTLELPSYIDAPNGFLVGVNTPNQFISLGTDDGIGEPYEFKTGTYYVNVDWIAGSEWIDAADLGCARNMMIRASGYKIGFDKTRPVTTASYITEPKLMLKKVKQRSIAETLTRSEATFPIPESYSLFRLLKGDEEFQDRWEMIATSISGTYYEDYSWNIINPGIYRYAVKALYPNGLSSFARLSNEIEKKKTFKVIVNVSTNSGDPVSRANFRFNSLQGFQGFNFFADIDETGVLEMSSVPEDYYLAEVILNGFKQLNQTDIYIKSDTSLVFVLEEVIINPFNLLVEFQGDTALFSWNNKPNTVIEDFEDFEDFTTDFNNWTTLNQDGLQSTLIQEFNFPHNGEATGFIVFNPMATVPPMSDFSAYSGQRCAAAISAKGGESSDWLISPRSEIVDGSIFSFVARSTSDMWELSTFKVKVSTTGINPEDFTDVNGFEFLVAPYWNWNEYFVDLSEYAGQNIYIAIEHTSLESYILLIDDLFIGVPESHSRSFVDYAVFLDGVAVANTLEEKFAFSNLEYDRIYSAGVAANFSTGVSEIKTIDFKMTDPFGFGEEDGTQISFYPNPSSGIVHLALTNCPRAGIEIFNSYGQIVFKEHMDKGTNKLTLPNLPKGLYLAKVYLPGKTVNKSFLII